MIAERAKQKLKLSSIKTAIITVMILTNTREWNIRRKEPTSSATWQIKWETRELRRVTVPSTSHSPKYSWVTKSQKLFPLLPVVKSWVKVLHPWFKKNNSTRYSLLYNDMTRYLTTFAKIQRFDNKIDKILDDSMSRQGIPQFNDSTSYSKIQWFNKVFADSTTRQGVRRFSD